MEQGIDPQRLAKRVIELLGGPEKTAEIGERELDEINSRWNQNIAVIGRILRSHLFVEHYVGEYLETANPRLGSHAKARLSFSQKIALLDPNDPNLISMLPGLKRINVIRNRLAHNLGATVSDEDAKIFLSDKHFTALRNELAEPRSPNRDPLDILEDFANHVSVRLGKPTKTSEAFAQAIKEEFAQPLP